MNLCTVNCNGLVQKTITILITTTMTMIIIRMMMIRSFYRREKALCHFRRNLWRCDDNGDDKSKERKGRF